MKENKPKMLYVYDYELYPYGERVPYSSVSLLEIFLEKHFEMFRLGEIRASDADVVFNALPIVAKGGVGSDLFTKGKITMFWNTVPLEHKVDVWLEQSDIVFVSSGIDAVENGKKVKVLHRGVNPYYRYFSAPFQYDIGFLGSEVVDYRINFLNKIEKYCSFLRGSIPNGLGIPSAQMLSKCRLVLSIEDYYKRNKGIEHRFWTFGNVRPIFMYVTPDLLEFFKDGTHFIGYKTVEEFMEKAEYFLSHMEEAEKIGQNLKKEFKKKHTYAHRAKEIYDVYKTL